MSKTSAVFSERDKKILYHFAKQCSRLKHSCLLDTNVLTPSNFCEEKEKFLQSKTYNPQFIYKKTPKNIKHGFDQLQKYLASIDLPKDLANYFFEYLDNLELLSLTISAIGTKSFAAYSQRLFRSYTSHTHETLQQLPDINFLEDEKHTLHTAEKIAAIFHNYLQQYDELSQYAISLDSFNDHTIRVGENRLIIGSRVKRTTENVRRLIVHEIESHIMQRHNARLSKNPLLKLIRTEEHEMLAEGLAVFNEIYTKTITRKAYNIYFYRLKAVAMLQKSFREIYDYLTNFLTPHQAFIITARVKRGMADTSQPGGFPKDAAYLLGYNRINEYVSHGGSLSSLYIIRQPEYGKLLAKYDLLTDANYVLPKFLEK